MLYFVQEFLNQLAMSSLMPTANSVWKLQTSTLPAKRIVSTRVFALFVYVYASRVGRIVLRREAEEKQEFFCGTPFDLDLTSCFSVIFHLEVKSLI